MSFWEFIKYLFLTIFFPRSLKTMEWRMLRLLNKDRKRYDLEGVRMQEDLRVVARKHSRDMAKKSYFEHTNLENKTPFDRMADARITDATAGENLAMIQGYKNPTQRAEIGLMNSPGHRANILNDKYNCVGIGVIQAEDRTYYFTQNFAKRDLVFTKEVPRTILLKKGLVLKGEAKSYVSQILIQVENQLEPGNITEKYVKLPLSSEFMIKIPFKKEGKYELKVFVEGKNKGTMHVANNFKVRVRKSFWNLIFG